MANAIHPDTSERPIPPPGAAYAAEEHADDAAGVVKERAGAMWQDAKDSARATLEERKEAAADGVGEFAGTLRDAARNRQRAEDDPVARLTESAADGLERLSSTLRSKDVNTMLRDVNAFAREQPVAFFGLALAAGFVVARLMKDIER